MKGDLAWRRRQIARSALWMGRQGGEVRQYRGSAKHNDAVKGFESLLATAARRHRRYWSRRDQNM